MPQLDRDKVIESLERLYRHMEMEHPDSEWFPNHIIFGGGKKKVAFQFCRVCGKDLAEL